MKGVIITLAVIMVITAASQIPSAIDEVENPITES
jgi:hypothetical protein